MTDGAGEAKTKFEDLQNDLGNVAPAAEEAGNGMKSAGEKANDFGNQVETAGKKTNMFSEGISTAKLVLANLSSSGIQSAISSVKNFASMIWNADETTAEFRVAMGKLNSAYDAAGYSADAAREAYYSFYGILGDTDRATEASQLLAQLVDKERDIVDWTDIAAGVWGTFGDSLPIEGLIEATNETAKVGQVTGVLADALNWVGISEDEFNEKLEACSSESERNRLIMSTLTDQYSDAATAFYQNNRELVQSRDAQTKLNKTFAEVGNAVQKVKTALIQELAPALGEIGAKVADFISGIDVASFFDTIKSFITVVVDNGSTILSVITGIGAGFLTWNIVSMVQGVIEKVSAFGGLLPMVKTGVEGVNTAMKANVIGIIITLIASLIGYFVNLYNTNEDFRNKVNAAWDSVKTTIFNAVEGIKIFFTETIPNAAKTALDWFKSIPDQMKEVGRNLLMGLWNGINDKVQWLKQQVSGVVDKIKSWFTGKDGFDEHSPSKWAKKVFEYVMQGGAQGVDSGALDLYRSVDATVNGVKNRMVLDTGSYTASFAASGGQYDMLLRTLIGEISELKETQKNMRVYLDSGALVGGIQTKVDQALGNIRANTLKRSVVF